VLFYVCDHLKIFICFTPTEAKILTLSSCLREELRQQELIKEELQRQQKWLASQQEYLASGRNHLPSRDDQGHVQMAVQFIYNKNPYSNYELNEIHTQMAPGITSRRIRDR
jgi:hypothetical protein